MTEAQRDVGLAAENVGHLVAEGQVNQHLRVACSEGRQQRHYGQPGMAQRSADPQAPAWHTLVSDGFFHFQHVRQHPPCAAQVGLSLGGEGERPGRAQQQAGTQALFGAGENAADRRGRQA
ncbi:hypothetical protein D9M71_732160 [compost metagenome]